MPSTSKSRNAAARTCRSARARRAGSTPAAASVGSSTGRAAVDGGRRLLHDLGHGAGGGGGEHQVATRTVSALRIGRTLTHVVRGARRMTADANAPRMPGPVPGISFVLRRAARNTSVQFRATNPGGVRSFGLGQAWSTSALVASSAPALAHDVVAPRPKSQPAPSWPQGRHDTHDVVVPVLVAGG